MGFLAVYMGVQFMSIPELESLSLNLSTYLLNKSADRKAVAAIIV